MVARLVRKTLIRGSGHMLLATCLFVGPFANEAEAQFGQKKKYDNDNLFVPESLKTPPDMPYLPPFTGMAPVSYDHILAFKRVPSCPGYTLTFHAKDTPEDVINFYRNAFKDNKWRPQKSGDTSRIVSGIRDGAIATVTVMKPIREGFKSQVYVVYKIFGPLN